MEGREQALLCKKTPFLNAHVWGGGGRKCILNNKMYIKNWHGFHNFWKCTEVLYAVWGFVFSTCYLCACMNGCIHHFGFAQCEIEHEACELAALLYKSSTV